VDNEWRLSAARPIVTKTEATEEQDENTEVVSPVPDTLAFVGGGSFSEGTVPTAMPEAVAEFSAEGHWVRLKLRGQFCCSIGFTFGEGGRSIELSDGNTRQSLGEIRMQGVNQSLVIEWAGDLDRDGKLDLIVADSTDHYDVRKQRLLLSSQAKRGMLT